MYLTRKKMEATLVRHFVETKTDEMVSYPFHADNRKFLIVAWIGTGASIMFNYFVDDQSYVNKLGLFDYYLEEAQWMDNQS